MVSYRLKPSKRAKHMRLAVHEGGEVVVTVPWRHDVAVVEAFLAKQADWLKRVVSRMSKRAPRQALPGGRADFLARKEEVRSLLLNDIEYWNRVYGFPFGRVSVRNQKTCWGSCSRRRNLSFNYRLVYLPADLRAYVVVHELCHLQAFGHGVDFWALVARAIPDWREHRQALRRYRLS